MFCVGHPVTPAWPLIMDILAFTQHMGLISHVFYFWVFIELMHAKLVNNKGRVFSILACSAISPVKSWLGYWIFCCDFHFGKNVWNWLSTFEGQIQTTAFPIVHLHYSWANEPQRENSFQSCWSYVQSSHQYNVITVSFEKRRVFTPDCPNMSRCCLDIHNLK